MVDDRRDSRPSLRVVVRPQFPDLLRKNGWNLIPPMRLTIHDAPL
jgi:hypothetical protein